MKKTVLGISIDDVNMNQAIEMVKGWLSKSGKRYIVTPNPEIVMMAQKDSVFKKILNDADLSIPDGVGLKLSGRVKNTFAGTDFMEKLVALAAKKGFVTGFLGAGSGVAEKTSECLKKKYPKLRVSFAESGGEINDQGESLGVLSARSPIRSPRFASLSAGTQWGSPLAATPRDIPSVDLLFVAFGPPKQEKWIAKNLSKLPVKVAMGVGGAFDYLSGKVPRAPIWIRNLGFEWLFRLCLQPWRMKRQLALIRYLYLLLRG